MGIERRKYRRVPLVTEVECSQSGESFLLTSRDLSIGGVFLHTNENFPTGTVLHLRFYLEEKNQVEVDGTVAYSVPGLGVGVEFVDLPKSQREALEQYVSSQT